MKDLHREVNRKRRGIAASVFVIWFGAALAWSIIGVDERRDPSVAAFQTTDLIVLNNITAGSGSALITTYPGNPSTHIGANKGSLILDTTTPALYQNTSGSNVWAIATGGGGSGSGFTVAGWGLIGSGSTVSLDSTGCSSGWSQVWNGTTWACTAPGALGSGSITISAGSATSPIALPTLGTTDWIDSLATTTHGGRILTCDPGVTNTCWMKYGGGALLINFDWLGIATNSPNGTVAGVLTFTAGSSDSMTLTALSSANTATTISTGSGVGIRWMLPSIGANVQRVARLYLYQYDNVVTCTATAIDGTASGSSATVNTGSGGVVAANVWTVTYKTNYSQPVVVTCLVTSTNTGAGNPAFGWSAASLGPT